MNERVSKLWDQAASECGYLRSGENSWDTQVRFINTFAELIVQECGIVINSENYREHSKGWNDAIEWADGIIKEHFGVEE